MNINSNTQIVQLKYSDRAFLINDLFFNYLSYHQTFQLGLCLSHRECLLHFEVSSRSLEPILGKNLGPSLK